MGGRSARAPARHECHHGAEGLDEHCQTIPITGRAPHQTKTPPAELTGHQVLAPRVGLEPTTTRLTAAGSTIELSRNLGCLFATRNSIGKSSSRARGNFGDFFMTLGPVLICKSNCQEARRPHPEPVGPGPLLYGSPRRAHPWACPSRRTTASLTYACWLTHSDAPAWGRPLV